MKKTSNIFENVKKMILFQQKHISVIMIKYALINAVIIFVSRLKFKTCIKL